MKPNHLLMHTSLAAFAAARGIPLDLVPIERKDAPDIETLIADHAKATEEAVGGVQTKTAELEGRVTEIEQKGARSGGRGGDERRTLGQLALDGREPDVKALRNQRGRLSMDVKAVITSLTTDADGSAGDLLRPYRDATVALPRRRFLVRDLLNVIGVDSNSVEVPKQTGRTINAAGVAEAALKPQSELKFDLVTVPIRTMAHWVLASRQILDDVPQLQGVIDGELRYGLMYVEENQLLNGAGGSTDLNGIYTQATAFSAGFTMVAPTKLDVIGLALLQNSLAEFPPDGIVMHPTDWFSIRLLKDGEGRYIMGPPNADIEPRLFGLPVAITQAMTVDKFLVGSFEQGATLYDRMEARVEISTEDSDNFRKNLVTVLAEERIGLDVKRTTAFTKADFSDAITAATAP